MLSISFRIIIFAPPFAQMAELVDALVSNTSGVKPVPVRPRLWAQSPQSVRAFLYIGDLFFSK